MIITLKLVGYNEDCNITINKEEISIVDIFNYFVEHELSFDEVLKITFINNGTNITNNITNIYKTSDGPFIVHLLIRDNNIRSEIIKNVFNKTEEKDELISDDMDKHNEEIIKLFSDYDFTYLLKICLTKPDLINKVSGYLLNGNITTEIKKINEDEFKYNDIYIKLVELLETLHVFKDKLEIKSIVQHFEGNLNLALRYLLSSCLHDS